MRRLWIWILSLWTIGHWVLALICINLLRGATYYVNNDGGLMPNCANGAEKAAVLSWALLFCSMVLGLVASLMFKGKRRMFAAFFLLPFLAVTAFAAYYNSLVPTCPG